MAACQSSEKPKASSQTSEAVKAASKASPETLTHASSDPVQEQVMSAGKRAQESGQRLVVYVGASWCEPCQVFLNALKAGELPTQLADLHFLKFDHDSDEARLEEAGYGGQMIPRFIVPAADGSATERRFEGSTKGPEAMANIVPRLEKILAEP